MQALKINGVEMFPADTMDNRKEQREIKSLLGHTGRSGQSTSQVWSDCWSSTFGVLMQSR